MNVPIKPSSASRAEEITGVLREEILRGQYRPGERLPSERDLAARFGANRGAVREALKKLEQMGIADINPGGVRVVPVEDATLDVLGHILDLDLESGPDSALVSQVFEVLGALMPMSARTAVRAASEAEIDDMVRITDQLIASSGDRERESASWTELGRLFTTVNHNLVLRLILNGLKTQFVGRGLPPNVTLDLDGEKHRAILNRMKQGFASRNAETAASAIGDHFDFVRESVTGALAAKKQARSVSHG